MSNSESPIRPLSPWPWWRWVLTTLCGLGLVLTAYLSWHYLGGSAMLGCGGGSACDEVLNSPWSTIAGVLPVSGLAAGAYLAMLVCSLSIGPTQAAPVRRLAWHSLLVLTGAAAGSAVWFTIVQKWFVGAFCPYCMVTHLTGLLLTGLAIVRAPAALSDVETDTSAVSAPAQRRLGPVIGRVALGVIFAALFAAAQVWSSGGRYRSGKALNQPASVDAGAMPLVGPPDARTVVTLFFDYKCPHCQQLHLMLGEVVRRCRGQLAFALRPAPLNRQCNPYVPRDVDEFKDSCELARVALAVWRADHEAFSVFETWMYSFDSGDRWRPRPLEAARAKAIELVGQAKFDIASSDPWIAGYLQESVRFFGETVQNGNGGVPKLVFGSRWVTSQPRNAADLIAILQTSLGIAMP